MIVILSFVFSLWLDFAFTSICVKNANLQPFLKYVVNPTYNGNELSKIENAYFVPL